MRLSLYLLLFIGIALEIKAHTTVQAPFALWGDPDCHYKPRFTAKQRSAFYPFSIASSVKLVSFRFNKDNVAVRKDSVLADSLVEIKTLNEAQLAPVNRYSI